MGKRMGIVLTLLCLILTLLATWQGAWAEEAGPLGLGGETVAFEGSEANGKALLEGYVGSLFGLEAPRPRGGVRLLTGFNRVLYDRLASFIREVAAGSVTDTETTLSFTLSELGLRKAKWYASDLGISAIVSNGAVTEATNAAVQRLIGYDVGLVIDCLRKEYPYEMYWFDIGRGYYYTYPGMVYGENGTYYVSFEDCSMRFSLSVAQDFAVKGYDGSGSPIYYPYKLDPGPALTAAQAAKNARNIVSNNSHRSNYEKLNAYRQKITDLTSYNDAAWNNGAAQQPYGNPWQLVWVFDGDPATKVVCEGYAKAFQYLCDQSSFKGDVGCITVQGTLDDGKGPEGHAWNIVHMNNGLNYLVDVTVCDSANLAEGNWLFMCGYTAHPADNKYACRISGTTFTYVYDAITSGLYDAAALQLCATPFNPVPTGVLINSTNFPDAAFRGYVSEEFDWDGDGALSPEEIRRADYVSVSGMEIVRLKGIEYLTALDSLYCNDNRLTSLDLSGNPLLTYLDCSENQLTYLDVRKNTELYSLTCWGNGIQSLNLSKNLALEYLQCSENQLTSLDVSANLSLMYLYCETNQLTGLNLSRNARLETLSCLENRLTALDVSANPRLSRLYCRKNQLTALDVTRNPALTKLDCGTNRLSALNLRRNRRLEELDCHNNALTLLDLANCPALVAIAGQSSGSWRLNYDTDQVTLHLHDNVLRLPESLALVEPYAFQGTAADVVEIPAACRIISANAFANCPNLKEVRFDPASEAAFDARAFGGAKPLIVSANPEVQACAEECALAWAAE